MKKEFECSTLVLKSSTQGELNDILKGHGRVGYELVQFIGEYNGPKAITGMLIFKREAE